MNSHATVVLIYAAGFIISWYLITGMYLADQIARCPQGFRYDLGEAVIMGVVFGIIWPLGLPTVFCLTGFAKNGIKFKEGDHRTHSVAEFIATPSKFDEPRHGSHLVN